MRSNVDEKTAWELYFPPFQVLPDLPWLRSLWGQECPQTPLTSAWRDHTAYSIQRALATGCHACQAAVDAGAAAFMQGPQDRTIDFRRAVSSGHIAVATERKPQETHIESYYWPCLRCSCTVVEAGAEVSKATKSPQRVCPKMLRICRRCSYNKATVLGHFGILRPAWRRSRSENLRSMECMPVRIETCCGLWAGRG